MQLTLPPNPTNDCGAASCIYPPPRTVLSATPANAAKKTENTADTQHSTISPLGICINLPTLADPLTFKIHNLVDALLAEVKLHALKYPHRPVTQLMWRNPYELMESAEVTEIMHALSGQFRLSPELTHEYCAEIDLIRATEEQIALLRGLGFNQLLIRLAIGSDTDGVKKIALKLSQRMQRLRDYEFESLGFKLVYGFSDHTPAALRQWAEMIVNLRPERIVLSDTSKDYQWDCQPARDRDVNTPPPSTQRSFAMLYYTIRNAGYRVIGNDYFVVPQDILATAQSAQKLRRTVLNYNASNAADLLGLGPGAYGQLGRGYYYNVPDIPSYIQALAQGNLPVKSRLVIDDQGHLLRMIIDQLLCYHYLDVAYFEKRYNVALMPLLSTALDHLHQSPASSGAANNDGAPPNPATAAEHPVSPSPLLQYQSNNRINLTPKGIFDLRAICGSLTFKAWVS